MKWLWLPLAATVVLTSCGARLQDAESAVGTSGLEAARPVMPTIAYVLVGADAIQREDRPAYVRPSGAAPILLGSGQQFATAGPETLLLERFDGHVQAYRVAPAPTLLYERMNQGGPPRGTAFGDEIYELQQGSLVATDQRGTTRQVNVPSALPGPVTICPRERGVFNLNASVIWALATTGGRLFAFSATLANGAILSLSDGRRVDLPASGPGLAMTVGADGKLYALTAGQQCGARSLVVRRIDPITMREEAAIDTLTTAPFVRAGLVSGSAGATYMHLVTDNAAELLRVDAQSVTPIALPPDSGLLSTAAPDGSIWLFGGRARNVVNRFDPSTGRVEHVIDADAPDGAYVGAVIFPSAGSGR